MPVLDTRLRPVAVLVRDCLTLTRQRARKRAEQVQIQARGGARFGAVFLCFDISRALRGGLLGYGLLLGFAGGEFRRHLGRLQYGDWIGGLMLWML